MKSTPSVVLIAVIALALVAGSVLSWTRYADPEWIPHTDASTASVVGRVLDAKANPIAGVELVWFAQAKDVGGAMMDAFAGGAKVKSDADGSFRFDSVPVDNGFVAIDEEASKCEGRTGEFAPRLGFDARIDVTATAVATGRVLRGRLLLQDGSPATQRFVMARASRWLTNWQGGTSTGADGSFEIVLPWEVDEVRLTWSPLDGSAPESEPVAVQPREGLEVRIGDGR